MNQQGHFTGHNLATLLQQLCDDEHTGILHFACTDKECHLFLHEGKVIYATSSNNDYKLGALMRRAGVITDEQLTACLSQARQSKQFLGQVINEQGYLSGDQVRHFSHEQVELIVLDLLLWPRGKFQYHSGTITSGKIIPCQLEPQMLITRAARRVDEMSFIRQTITSEDAIFQRTTLNHDAMVRMELTEAEKTVLRLVDGQHNVKQLAEQSTIHIFDLYKILFVLILAGLLEEKMAAAKPPAARTSKAVPPTGQAATAAAPKKRPAFSFQDDIDPQLAGLLHGIRSLLAEAVGPVATIIMEDNFSQWCNSGETNLAKAGDFIALLAAEIDDIHHAADFERRSLQLAENHSQQSATTFFSSKAKQKNLDTLLQDFKDALLYTVGPFGEIIFNDSIKHLESQGTLSKEQLSQLKQLVMAEIDDAELAASFSNRLHLSLNG